MEITGKHKPRINQIFGFRPKRFASRDVIIGMLSKNKRPRLQKRTAPMVMISICVCKSKKRPAFAGLFNELFIRTIYPNHHNQALYLVYIKPIGQIKQGKERT